MKLRGFDKQRQNDSLGIAPGSLYLRGLSSLRLSEDATTIRGGKTSIKLLKKDSLDPGLSLEFTVGSPSCC